MVRSITDLYHGERFAYVDFAMEALIKRVNDEQKNGQDKRKIVMFYDVNCQYYPHTLVTAPYVDPLFQITAAQPTWHCLSHEEDCQLIYHPLRIPRCGLVDGECTERLWSKLGPFHNMVKEMLPSTRHEQIEDCIFHLNQLKVHGLGDSLGFKLQRALGTYQNAVQMFAAVMETHQVTVQYVHHLVLKQRQGKPIVNLKGRPKTEKAEEENQNLLLLQLSTIKGHLRELAVFRFNMLNLKRGTDLLTAAPRFLGGQRNTSNLIKAINHNDSKIKKVITEYNDKVADLVSEGIDSIPTVNFPMVVRFKSEFWAGSNIASDISDSRQIIDAYSSIERHLEEIWLLTADSKRFKDHLAEDAGILEDYLAVLRKDDWIHCSQESLSQKTKRALISQISRKMSQLFDIHNNHCLPIYDLYEIPASTLPMVTAIEQVMKRVLGEDYIKNMTAVPKTTVAETSSEVPPAPSHQSAPEIPAPSHQTAPEIPLDSAIQRSEDIASPTLASYLVPLSDEDDEELAMENARKSSHDTKLRKLDHWAEILRTNEWLECSLLHEAYDLMYQQVNPELFGPPMGKIGRRLKAKSTRRKTLINWAHHQERHWITLKVESYPNVVTVYNSLNNNRKTVLGETLLAELKEFYSGEDFEVKEVLNVQQQPDFDNCGVFCIMFAQSLYSGERPEDFEYHFTYGTTRKLLSDGLMKGLIDRFPRKNKEVHQI